MRYTDYRISDGKDFKLLDFDTRDKADLEKRQTVDVLMPANIAALRDLQEKLFADDSYAVLLVIQAMDAAGKDGIVKHVMGGLNPAGTRVTSFKAPTSLENDHDYLWRIHKEVPRRGEIGIFNRSHYEEVIIARVHDLVRKSQIPDDLIDENIWKDRYRQINDYERYLSENGIKVVKVYLHLSKEEQRLRLLDRIENPDKHWKFNQADIEERQYWDQYQDALESMIRHTSTKHAPWFVVPADRKWFARYLVSEILRETMDDLGLDYPELSPTQLEILAACHDILTGEDGGAER